MLNFIFYLSSFINFVNFSLLKIFDILNYQDQEETQANNVPF